MANLHGLSQDRLKTLKNEIVMARKLNKEELEPGLIESIERYTGMHVPRFGVDWDIILNEVYPVIQNNLPSIFFRNPRAFLKPRNKTYIAKKRNLNSGEMEDVQLDSGKSAKTQEAILNYQITKQIKYKPETRKTLMDALLFPYGVMWHGYKGDFGMTEEQSLYIENDTVFTKRTSPMRFIYDPSVTISDIEEAKWVGRLIDIPLTDLIEDNILDVDKTIKGFPGYGMKIGKATQKAWEASGGKDKLARKSLLEFASDDFKKGKLAQFVTVAEIYLRPTKKEKRDGSKGWILVLTEEQEKPLRVSPWKIKAKGWPAKILQFNELNDHQFGLSDVEVYSQEADQKNVIINLQIRNAQEMSKTWVGISKENANEEDIEKVQAGTNTIVLFESGSPRERMFVASGGGSASNELYILDQRIQKNIEDKSGVTDLKRGFLQSGEESAASVKVRSAGGSVRPAYRQDIMSDFLVDSLTYINQLDKQFITFKDAVRIVGSLDIEWSEKPTKEALQADVDVEIDVVSMLPENPEKELRELHTLLSLMIQAIMQPSVMSKIQQEGKTFNLSPVIEQMLQRMKIRDPEIFRGIKPEESQGFVSVQQIREAKDNVTAALENKQIPHPPTMEDDHRAKLEVYSTISELLKKAGQMSDVLEQLIQIHTALIQKLQEKEDTPGKVVKFPQAKVQTVASR